jgi:hypothetical protein
MNGAKSCLAEGLVITSAVSSSTKGENTLNHFACVEQDERVLYQCHPLRTSHEIDTAAAVLKRIHSNQPGKNSQPITKNLAGDSTVFEPGITLADFGK